MVPGCGANCGSIAFAAWTMSTTRYASTLAYQDINEPWKELGEPDQLERRGLPTSLMSVTSRQLQLTNGKTYYLNIYLIDDR